MKVSWEIFKYMLLRPVYDSIIIAARALWKPWNEIPWRVKRLFNESIWFRCDVCGRLCNSDYTWGDYTTCRGCYD